MALLVALALLAAGPAAPDRAAAGEGGLAVSAAELQARHGLRLTRVALTGGGGLVDLRFTVVDPGKARAVLGEAGHEVRLVAGGGPALEAPHHGAMRNVRVARDAACFLLFPNARQAIRRGDRVAVAFGEVVVPGVLVE